MAASNRDDESTLQFLPDELLIIFGQSLPPSGQAAFARTSARMHDFFQPGLTKAAVKLLLQAVVHDNQAAVKRLLDNNLRLLLAMPAPDLVIENQYTWQKIIAEDALTMAIKLRQVNMVKLLLSYYDKLPQTDEVLAAKAKGLSTLKRYETQQNANGQSDIVIPAEYAHYANTLINAFSAETFPHGKAVDSQFSAATEDELKALLNLLIPKTAVKLDSLLDPELFLLALYQAYDRRFDDFQNGNQGEDVARALSRRDAFCVRVIGLVQSVLTPETAKVFCEGLYYVVDQNRAIGARAESLKLLNWGNDDLVNFYRSGRLTSEGLGKNYLAWLPLPYASGHPGVAWSRWRLRTFFKTFVKQKQQSMDGLRAHTSRTYHAPDEQMTSCSFSCVIA